ncbi:MAG: PEGA domain-containing protein [Spirochaetes bacterium]|nr:PEGA domain-containing protein [Spirochaetota bacterium]
MSSKTVFTLIIALAAGLMLFGGQKPNKTRVGIIDFSTKGGVSASDAETIGEIFRSKLVTRDVFDVLERNSMNSILKEQELQNTGCTESSCAVQIGKILNMEYMIYGTIMQASDNFYLTITMIHIESSKTIISIDDKFTSIENIIQNIPDIVKKLADNSKVRKRAENILEGNGMLKITCAQAGSQIIINGRSTGQTPLLLEAKAGTYDITISHDGFLSKRFKFTVEEGLINEINESLSAGLGLEEAERKRNDYFWGFIRNGSITAAITGMAIGSAIIGNYFNEQGDQIFSQYNNAYITSESTQLGDTYQKHFDMADAFFYATESLAVAGAVFLTFSIIDFIQWNQYADAASRISPFALHIHPCRDGANIQVSMKF